MKLSHITLLGAALALAVPSAALAERGTDGQLRILYSQAPSILNPYLSTGAKDSEPASLVLDPMANYDHQGKLVPALAVEIPTVENGGVAADLKSITWKLKDDLVWSDGTAVTSEDVVFSGNYCLDPAGGCASTNLFSDVESIEALDDKTVRVNFSVAKPYPYGPFVSSLAPVIQKAQFENCIGAKASECTEENFNPIGTGPYVVEDFRANDVITFGINNNYRDASKPAFDSVVVKGGGDALAAARAVMETGEFDFAWNVQVEPEILAQLEAAGKGKAIAAFGSTVERLMMQTTSIDPALGEKRATIEGGPHPFMSDIKVRKALSMAIDRNIIVEAGYGPSGQPTCNVVTSPADFVSSANDSCLTADVAGANALLDEAGWARGADGIREKDGVRLSILFQTSTNSVRQGTQALIKQAWSELGVETELRSIDAGVFFSTDPSSPDTYVKFFADVQEYAGGFSGGDPESFLNSWACNTIPSAETNWLGQNTSRFCSEEFDARLAELAGTASFDERIKLVKEMNDELVQSYTVIPLVHRGIVSARSNALENVEANDWDSTLAQVEDWTRSE